MNTPRMYSSMNVHNAVSIAARSRYLDGVSQLWLTVLTIETEGGEFILSVMSKEPLQIEGSEHVNHVASPEVYDVFTVGEAA